MTHAQCFWKEGHLSSRGPYTGVFRPFSPDRRKCLPHTLFHCLDGDLEHVGDLGVPESLLPAQLKDLTAVCGQATYRIAHRPLELDAKNLLFRGW